MIKNILFLAAGFGSRTKQNPDKELPKGAFKDSTGKTLIDRILEQVNTLSSQKNKLNFTLITNNRFYDFYKNWTQKNLPDSLIINNQANHNDNRPGALADLVTAIKENHWENDGVLVLPTDTYVEKFDFVDFSNFCQQHDQGLTTVFRKFQNPNLEIASRLGCAILDEHYKVSDFFEKPLKPISNLGAVPIYFLSSIAIKKLIQYVDQHLGQLNKLDSPGIMIPYFLSAGLPIYGYVIESETKDIGTPSDIIWLRDQ